MLLITVASNGRMTIYSNDMKSYGMRLGIAQFLGIPKEQVRVVWMEGPQAFGRTAADDAGFEAAFLAKGGGVEDADVGGAVAQVKIRAVGGKTPTLAGIGEVAEALKSGEFVHESDLRLPGELHDFVLHDGDTFAEILQVEIDTLDNFSRFEADFAERGASFEAGAFVEKSRVIDETLSEGFGIVRKRLDDFESVFRRALGGRVSGLRTERRGNCDECERQQGAGTS